MFSLCNLKAKTQTIGFSFPDSCFLWGAFVQKHPLLVVWREVKWGIRNTLRASVL